MKIYVVTTGENAITVSLNGEAAVAKTVKPTLTALGNGKIRFECDGISEEVETYRNIFINAVPLKGSWIAEEDYLSVTLFEAVMNKTFVSSPGGSSYLSYTGFLNQTGGDAPVETILENTLGFTPTFTRETSGEYTIVKDGGWNPAKTWFVLQPCDAYNDNSCRSIQAEIVNDGPIVNQIYFTTRDVSGAANDWGGAQGTAKLNIEIRIYP